MTSLPKEQNKESFMTKLLSFTIALSGLAAGMPAAHAETFAARRDTRVITIVGHGKGGTTVGDKAAACDRAYERAEDDAYDSCADERGYVLSTEDDSCRCTKKSGSRDDYNCEARVYADCEVRR
jgi:hypothetical protein